MRAPKGGPYFRGEHSDYAPSRAKWYEWTGEFRPPVNGEYYLSGAEPIAWRALGNLKDAYHIMRGIEGPPREIKANGRTYKLVE